MRFYIIIPVVLFWLFVCLAKGQSSVSDNEMVRITLSDKIHGFGSNYDPDIYSPKSVIFSKDGKKLYVNSLEGCKTVVYDALTHEKLKVISHSFETGSGSLWLEASGFYPFSHYPDGNERAFKGKPVEGALSKDGKYLFVSYYRRTFDINAQDPSAIAVIDTESDEIVLMIETGPLPKMVKVSNDGKILAVTHWGDNTIGLIDISDKNPKNWRYRSSIVVDRKLDLNFRLDSTVNRDANSGFLLRGTVFLPGDSVLLVGGMAGPMAVIDVNQGKWVGSVSSLYGIRHLTMKGGRLYMTRNSAGEFVTVPADSILKAIDLKSLAPRDFHVNGIERLKIGQGARTLQTSPSGRFVFIACNNTSEIVTVDADRMKVINRIAADPYPVGLDISPDGLFLVSTSQGRNGIGGNAVNFFELEYAMPEIPIDEDVETADKEIASSGCSTAQPESKDEKGTEGNKEESDQSITIIIWLSIGVVLIAIILCVITMRRNRRR